MKIETEKKTMTTNVFVCETCNKRFYRQDLAEDHEEEHKKELERKKWFESNSPKFQKGDIVKFIPNGRLFLILKVTDFPSYIGYEYLVVENNDPEDIESKRNIYLREENLELYMDCEKFLKLIDNKIAELDKKGVDFQNILFGTSSEGKMVLHVIMPVEEEL